VRDLSEDGLNELQAMPSVLSVEVRHPSLEELFVACMQSEGVTRWEFPEMTTETSAARV